MTRQAIEPLESRIAPAVTIINPIFDIQAGAGATGTVIDLAKLVDPTASHRTLVEFTTNLFLPGQTEPGKIVIELFDDKAPLSVQNFLRYVEAGTYDGNFFHRIFDFGSSSGTGTDIIQGGGFKAGSMFSHVSTFTTVHNEFDATDPELQNVRGTLAMAKTSISPNTASSEWFFNLTDNSSILGAENNGGFTVFGKITTGLEIADAIGQAQKTNIGGALTDLPVQNYSSGLPSQSQLIQITDARIVETHANADGHTFSVTSSAPDIVKTKVNPLTNELTLTYVKGKAGPVTITVTATKNGESNTDTFDVNLTPNVISTVEKDSLPGVIVPGDKGLMKVKLANNAGGSLNGPVKVRLYLSSTAGSSEDALRLDANDIEITPANTPIFDLAIQSGKTTTLSVPYLIPDTLNDGTTYIVLAVPEATTPASQDLFTDDNVGLSFDQHTFSRSFGTIGSRSKVPLTVTDASGDEVTFTIIGPGIGSVTKDASGILDIAISNSTAATSVIAKTAKGVVVDIDDIFIHNTVGSVKLGTVNLHGNFTASGGAKSIVLGDLGTATGAVDKSLSIGQFPAATQKLAASFGQVNDYTFFSATPVSTFSAASWLNDESVTAQNEINVAAISAFKIAGDMEAKLIIASSAKTGLVSVGGAFRGGELNAIGDVTSMKFGSVENTTIKALGSGKTSLISISGVLRDSQIRTVGDVSAMKVGSVENSSILVGLTERPDSLADFATGRTLASFSVAGNVTGSTIAASTINSFVIGSADGLGELGGGVFADAIKSYLRKGSQSVKKLTNLTAPAPENQPYDTLGDGYAVNVF